MQKLHLISLWVFCLLSCNQRQSPQQSLHGGAVQNIGGNSIIHPPARKDTALISNWNVKGCAEKAAKGDTKSPNSGEFNDYPDLPMPGDNSINATADSIVYSRYVHHGCCRKAGVSIQRQDKRITIIEYWTGRICKCMCNSIIRAVIQKLPKGEYQVYGIETGTDPIDDKPNDGKDTVMRQIVTIK